MHVNDSECENESPACFTFTLDQYITYNWDFKGKYINTIWAS